MELAVVVRQIWYLSICSVFIFGCANKPVHVEKTVVQEKAVEVSAGIKGAPDWVNKGSNFATIKDSRFIWGVSFATPQGDMALQKALADDNARDEVAHEFSYYLDMLTKDHTNSSRITGSVLNEDAVLRMLKMAAKESLGDIRIIGGWRDQKTNSIWSIAELDIKRVKLKLAESEEMSADLKRYIETTAESIFDRIARDKNRESSFAE